MSETNMSDNDNIRELFETRGESFEIFKYLPPDKIFVWDKSIKAKKNDWTGMGGGNFELIRVLKLQDIELEVLKNMKVYPMLSNEVKAALENHVYIDKSSKVELMAKARAGRKTKYTNIPSELTCIECGNTVESNRGKVARIVEKEGGLLIDYIAKFKCKKCAPVKHRGKQANPLYANLPKELVCKCGAKVGLNPFSLKAKADRLGITMQEAIENYACQVCAPSRKGRTKVDKGAKVDKVDKVAKVSETTNSTTTRGRKPNQEFIGLPKRMTCKCGKDVASNLDYLKVKAEKLGVTIMSLIEGYRCSTCRKL